MSEGSSRFQRSLAAFCHATADRDPRNLRTAQALEEFADYLLGLTPDDPRLLDLQRLAGEGDDFAPDQRVLYEIGRFRFHHPDVAFAPFLETLVELAKADRGEAGHFGGRMPEGDDPWG